MKNLLKLKRNHRVESLFQLHIHALEDFTETKTKPSDTSLLDTITSLLDTKYSISWNAGKKSKGVTETKLLSSKFYENVDDLKFIDSQMRKSLNNMKSNLIRGSRRMIYVVDFQNYSDFVCSFHLDLSRSIPTVKDKLLLFEIREHDENTNESKVVGTVTTNLVDFTTPLSSMGSLKRSVLFPVRLSNNKSCKLRVTISSIWLNTNIFNSEHVLQRSRTHSGSTPVTPSTPHHTSSLSAISSSSAVGDSLNEYFVVEEDEQLFVLPSKKSSFVVMTPLAKTSTTTTSLASGTSQVVETTTSPRDGNSPVGPSTPRQQQQQSQTPSSPQGSFGLEASHFVTQVRKLKSEIAKLETDKKELQTKLTLFEQGTAINIETDSASTVKLKYTIQNLDKMLRGLQEQFEEYKSDLSKISSKLQLFQIFKQGLPKFVISPELILEGKASAHQLATIVYFDLQGRSKLWNIPEDKITKCLEIYNEIIKDCMKQCNGMELDTEGLETQLSEDGIFCCFESAKMAIRFCLLLQLKLSEAEWPIELMDTLDEEEEDDHVEEKEAEIVKEDDTSSTTTDTSNSFKGLRVRMAIDCGVLLPSSAFNLQEYQHNMNGNSLENGAKKGSILLKKKSSTHALPLHSSPPIDDTSLQQNQLPICKYHFDMERKCYIYFGELLKRVLLVSQLAQGGQCFITENVWNQLQEENKLRSKFNTEEDHFPPIRTIVQDLGVHNMQDIVAPKLQQQPQQEWDVQKWEHLRLIIPEKCMGREFSTADLDKLSLKVKQSYLLNHCFNDLQDMKGEQLYQLRSQLNQVEEKLYKLSMMFYAYEDAKKDLVESPTSLNGTEKESIGLLKQQQKETMLGVEEFKLQLEKMNDRLGQYDQAMISLSKFILRGEELSSIASPKPAVQKEQEANKLEEEASPIASLPSEIRDHIIKGKAAQIRKKYDKLLELKESQIHQLEAEKETLQKLNTDLSEQVKSLTKQMQSMQDTLAQFKPLPSPSASNSSAPPILLDQPILPRTNSDKENSANKSVRDLLKEIKEEDDTLNQIDMQMPKQLYSSLSSTLEVLKKQNEELERKIKDVKSAKLL